MKKKKNIEDFEIHINPKPLTKAEELALSKFIKDLKAKNKKLSASQKYAA